MLIEPATDQRLWDDFLTSQPFSPFLQSWTMGEVYRAIGQEPVRIWARDGSAIQAICQGIVVPARRGKHMMVQYGPICHEYQESGIRNEELQMMIDALKKIAVQHQCSFIRISPFYPAKSASGGRSGVTPPNSLPSPLHLLAEHIWYLPLKVANPWVIRHGEPVMVSLPNHESMTSPVPLSTPKGQGDTQKTEEEIFKAMRSTTRNLIRRAEKEGVTIECSMDPVRDVEEFIRLHDVTRKRHKFVPYSNAFFRAQVRHFTPSGNALVYLARYQGRVIASSIHMQFGGETSYHHGASSHEFSKIPASYLLQWTAIRDALRRGDTIYNFWGIAPIDEKSKVQSPKSTHPFSGVTLFKTGFGGTLLNLTHCMDIALSKTYYLTRAFEYVRKWRRGF